MKWISTNAAPPLVRLLLLAGAVVASATGCHMEAEAPADNATENVGEVANALASTYFDFLGNAAGAAWHNNDGGLPFGTNDSRGACLKSTGAMENGVSVPYLFSHPKLANNGFMHAAYTVAIPAAALNPSFTATFGFTSGASGTGGVRFSLTTQINGAWVTLFSQTKNYTGALSTQTVNLSAYAGQTLTLFLNTDANGASNYDWAAWTDARITIDGTPGPIENGCTIGGVTYPNGAVHPTIGCQVCNPLENATGWSVRGDSCYIGSTCYAADQLDALGCRRCDPLTSQTAWTNKTACDNIIVAATNATTEGGTMGGIAGADAKCAAEGAALGLPGLWRAMISHQGVRDFKDAVPGLHWSKPVVNLQGQQMYGSWQSIFSNQVWPSGLSMYTFGNSTTPAGSAFSGRTWTGTEPGGTWANVWEGFPAGDNCWNWTASWWLWDVHEARISDYAARKLVDSGITTTNGTTWCSNLYSLGCVLTPSGLQVNVENYDGTALGTVEGKTHNNSYAYLSIPYAAAPTGSLRFAPPAKATSWSGVRTAFNQPPPCPQPPLLPLGGMIGSEDCLFLNVWTPKTANPASPTLPVLVYQFGGGHIFGGTASADDWLATGFLDGDRFAAAQNAIIVTIQTRTGALGWLTDPALAANSTSRTSTVGGGTSGNYGLLDALQSLKWVKRNISKFGGDPNKVTFFGESSGGTIVCDLMASPLAKDPADNKPYFSSIIIESGFCENPLASFRQTQATPIITSVGCNSASDKVACLRAASVQSFVSSSGAVLEFFPDLFGQNLPPEFAYGLKFGPHVDGYVLPTHPRLMFAAGTHNKVPAIVGTNKDEATFFMLFMVGGILTGDLPNLIVLATCNDFITKTNLNLGSTLATSARTLYPCNGLDLLGPTKSYAQGVTHLQYECPARRTARALDLGQTQNVYRYWFTHRGDNLGIFHNLLGLVRDIGASHTFELPFVFNTHNTMLWYWPSTRERALTTSIQSYWRNFANSGNPNYTGGVNWPAYDRTVDNTLQLEVTGVNGGTQVVNNPNGSKCDFWDNNFNLDGWK